MRTIRKNQEVRKKFIRFRKRQVNQKHYKNISLRRCWKLKYFTMIITTYVGCGLPWIMGHIVEGFDAPLPAHAHFIVLLVYSWNFFFPAVVCVSIWHRQRK